MLKDTIEKLAEGMSKTNYSYQTSLPAYHEPKAIQLVKVLGCIKTGKNCLLAISEEVGLPQSTVAGRVNDLIEEGKVMYSDFIIYKNRKRKRIVLKTGQLTLL